MYVFLNRQFAEKQLTPWRKHESCMRVSLGRVTRQDNIMVECSLRIRRQTLTNSIVRDRLVLSK